MRRLSTSLLVFWGVLWTTGLLALTVDLDPEQALAPLNHGAFLWKGFDHHWVEDGHRIGNHASFVSDTTITETAGAIRAQGQAVMKLSVGADGDYARPRVLYNFVYARTIGVTRGQVTFTFRSDLIPGLIPEQSPPHILTQRWRQSLRTPEMRYGALGHYAAILQGFDVTVRCPEDQDACHPSSWLREFGIALDNCTTQGGEYACDTQFSLQRYHSPDALRSMPTSVVYQVTVYYTIFGGAPADFTSTLAGPVLRNTRLKGAPLSMPHDRVTGACRATDPGCLDGGAHRYEVAVMGLLGFRYQLNRLPAGPPALGRYMKRLTFQLADGAYDPNTGTMDYRVVSDYLPAVPLAYDSQIQYQMTARLLQFRQADILGDRDTTGVICQYTFLTMGVHRCVSLFGSTYAYPKLQDVVPITN